MLDSSERLKFCKICVNRKFDTKTGVVCSLTDKKPVFNYQCNYFEKDSNRLKIIQSELDKKEMKYTFPKGAVAATIIGFVVIVIKAIING